MSQATVHLVDLHTPAPAPADVEPEIQNAARRLQVSRRRGWARWLAARELGVGAKEIRFVRMPGQPMLPGTGVHLSLSSSGWLATIVLADRPVGIDIESDRGLSDWPVLLRPLLAERERAALSRLEGEALVLGCVQLWTAKEAFAKLDGRGLGDWLSEVALWTEPDTRVKLQHWSLEPNFQLTLASREPIAATIVRAA